MKDCALGLVLSADGRDVLLVQRRDVPVWVLPGGGIDAGETPEEAACREVFEETGLDVRALERCAHYLPVNRFTQPVDVILCAPEKGRLQAGQECRDVRYFPLNALPKELFPYHREWLAESLSSSSVVERTMSKTTFWAVIRYYFLRPHWGMRYLWTRATRRFLGW